MHFVEDHSADFDLVQQCLLADGRALVELREKCHSSLLAFLVHSGASEAEAEDIVDALWCECVKTGEADRVRLRKFHGRCAVSTWLKAITLNDLINHRRHQSRLGVIAGLVKASGYSVDEFPSAVPSELWQPSAEASLLKIMGDALQQALEECSSSGLVMLHLVYMRGVTQREIGRMWGWPEWKVSREMEDTMKLIASRTLEGMRAVDSWLEIGWEDFLQLCVGADFSLFG